MSLIFTIVRIPYRNYVAMIILESLSPYDVTGAVFKTAAAI